jgi:hypothetical protein
MGFPGGWPRPLISLVDSDELAMNFGSREERARKNLVVPISVLPLQSAELAGIVVH